MATSVTSWSEVEVIVKRILDKLDRYFAVAEKDPDYFHITSELVQTYKQLKAWRETLADGAGFFSKHTLWKVGCSIPGVGITLAINELRNGRQDWYHVAVCRQADSIISLVVFCVGSLVLPLAIPQWLATGLIGAVAGAAGATTEKLLADWLIKDPLLRAELLEWTDFLWVLPIAFLFGALAGVIPSFGSDDVMANLGDDLLRSLIQTGIGSGPGLDLGLFYKVKAYLLQLSIKVGKELAKLLNPTYLDVAAKMVKDTEEVDVRELIQLRKEIQRAQDEQKRTKSS